MKKSFIIFLIAFFYFNINMRAFSIKEIPVNNVESDSIFNKRIAILSQGFTFDNSKNIITSPLDSIIFAQAIDELFPKKYLPAGELLFETAQHFIGTSYIAGTLEIAPNTPVINLHETDCILFVEMCCAITALIKESEYPPHFKQYCDKIVEMRYRKGESPDYGSRLHYTSEWIIQNSDAGFFREITSALGIPLQQQFYFMSANKEKYPCLIDNPSILAKIKKAEKKLDGYNYFMIPCRNIPEIIDQIETGDIICFVSKSDGLDISHTGIAFRDGETVRFIHASMRDKKVVKESRTLLQYCKTGIRLLRISPH